RNLGAQHRFGERHRNVDGEVGVDTPEDRMLLNADDDVQIARLAARNGTAATANADARGVADPGRDLHLHVFGLVLDTGAVAHGTGVLDLTAAPAACWARAREREHALALLHCAGAATGRARMRPPRPVARTTARRARRIARHAHGNR